MELMCKDKNSSDAQWGSATEIMRLKSKASLFIGNDVTSNGLAIRPCAWPTVRHCGQ